MSKTKNKKTATIFVFIVAVFVFIGFLFYKLCWFDVGYDDVVTKYCTQYDVPKDLVYAIIKTESNFDVDATSNKGAKGLMQLMPQTAVFVSKQLGVDNFSLTDPKQNLQFGIFYLSYLQTKFYDIKDVVASYNAGENKVLQWKQQGVEIQYKETKNYLKKVMFLKKVYNFLHK